MMVGVLALMMLGLTDSDPSWLEEAKEHWSKQEALLPTEVEYFEQSVLEDRGDQLQNWVRVNYSRHGQLAIDRQVMTLNNGESTFSETGYILNSRYAFKVSRNSENANWILKSVVHPESSGYQSIADRLVFYREQCGRMGFLMQGSTFSTYIEDPHLEIIQAEKLSEQQFSVSFKVNAPDTYRRPDGIPFYSTEGRILFDPSNHWRLVESRVQQKNGWTVTTRPSYLADRGNVPVKIHASEEDTRKYHRTRELKSYSLSKTFPESDFRLPAFGLPEPEEFAPTTRWPWYLGIGAVALIFLGLVIRHKSR